MLDTAKIEFLDELAQLDTGKAQPLFHPFPVINIFREDESLKAEPKKEKQTEDELLLGKKAVICDGCGSITSEIEHNLVREGTDIVNISEETDFVIAMDKEADFLKYAVAQGGTAIKSTYGLVSRYGMEMDAPSLSQPAVMADNSAVCAAVLQAMAAVDSKDPMSRDAYIYEYVDAVKEIDLTGMKIAIPASLPGMEVSEAQLVCYNQMLDVLEARGAEIETVELDWVEYAVPVYEIISACEKVMTADEIALSCAAEDETLQFGSFLLQEDHYRSYYLKALKLRSLIKDSYDLLFREYALLAFPYIEETDAYSVAANLAGLPAMSVPYAPYDIATVDGTKVIAGIHMIAGANYENNLLKAANAYEQEEK